MQKKYNDLCKVEKEIVILPSSVPHLLHWDIAYLWMLERPEVERPKEWQERIKAWKHLVGLLLLANVTVREETILPRLAEYAAPWGIGKILWLVVENDPTPLGIVSPLVLVRPLPDFTAAHCTRWPADPNDNGPQRSLVGHFLALAIKRLQEIGQQGDFPKRLADILRKEFDADPTQIGPGYRSRAQEFIFWRRIHWVPRLPDPLKVTIEIWQRGKPRWFPQCDECRRPLTVEDDAEPIKIPLGANDFSLRCPRHGPKLFSLDKLMLWQRTDQNVVAWTDRDRCPGVPLSADAEVYPPDARVEGDTVEFVWDPGELGGETAKRFLKLKFENRRVQQAKFDDIRFLRLLVIGQPEAFQGLPIRPEWRDALAEYKPPDWDAQHTYFRYQLKLKGWPFEFILNAVTLGPEPDLMLGIYPEHIPGWKPYRIFLVGRNHSKYGVRQDVAGERRLMPWCLDVKGWPEQVAVTGADDPSTGCLLVLGRPTYAPPKEVAELFVGVDFGTTNSLVYFADRDDLNGLDPAQGENAAKPRDLFQRAAKVLAGESTALNSMSAGWFLPGTDSAARDEFLIPSAFWDGGQFPVIRWNNKPPFAGANTRHGFKWDSNTQDFSRERQDYLKELLFLVVPYAIKRKGFHNKGVNLRVGWAFPLAFSYEARRKMRELLDRLRTQMQDWGLPQVDCYSVDESQANVIARGSFNPGETFLVADMGGGTLDLAMFCLREAHGGPDPVYQQIGSIRFAGEDFLKRVIERKKENLGDAYWRYRDAIENPGAGAGLQGDRVASDLFDQFSTMAFEFLRTMYLAHAGDGSPRLQVVLAGNGWRLIESVSKETPSLGERKVLFNFRESTFQSLDLRDFSAYSDQVEPSRTKHFVAIGALKNANKQGQELAEGGATVGSKLPAGRTVRIRSSDGTPGIDVTIAWRELVGDGGRDLGYSAQALRGLTIDVQAGPTLTGKWGHHFDNSLAMLKEPPPERIQEWIRNCLEGTSQHLLKGPLQLIMEHWWLGFLGGGPLSV